MKNIKRGLVGCLVLILGGCLTPKGPDAAVQEQVRSLSAQHALVVAGPDGNVRFYDGRGLRPLFDCLKEDCLKDAYVYDKVTGRASALLLAYGGAKALHTGLLSEEAVPILKKYAIVYTADKTTPYILNRAKTGSCPMETLARNLDDAQSAYPQIKAGFEKLTGYK